MTWWKSNVDDLIKMARDQRDGPGGYGARLVLSVLADECLEIVEYEPYTELVREDLARWLEEEPGAGPCWLGKAQGA